MANYDASISKSSRSTRQRHFYDEAQLAVLNAEFARNSFPSRECRRRIALLIGVSNKSIMWWFQNRRRRIRQRGFGLGATAQSYETSRQQRRSSPYAIPSQRVQQDVVFNSIEDRLLKSPIVKPLDLNEVMKLNLNQIDAAKVESEADSDQQE
ncbi:hypothetical protein OUZ56_022103 [Daphnia magna]|uniref:Homeobox domain-containing protein n=1 Tax=Daphnia magna TaxID=35525 RepID=A0ABR0AVH3_9CRUS|nr:hypothetical protein OUZ56_022103 [Daphnia magna]